MNLFLHHQTLSTLYINVPNTFNHEKLRDYLFNPSTSVIIIAIENLCYMNLGQTNHTKWMLHINPPNTYSLACLIYILIRMQYNLPTHVDAKCHYRDFENAAFRNAHLQCILKSPKVRCTMYKNTFNALLGIRIKNLKSPSLCSHNRCLPN